MKTFLSNIIPNIVRFSEIKDIETIIINQPFVLYSDAKDKILYIFRKKDNELLISVNGIVTKGKWDFIDQNILLIDTIENSYLFNIGLVGNEIIILGLIGKKEYAFLYNENRINLLKLTLSEIEKYIENKSLNTRENQNNSIANYSGINSITTTFGLFRQADKTHKEAFCLGCRKVDSSKNLYYCKERDIYYHYDCLKEYMIDIE